MSGAVSATTIIGGISAAVGAASLANSFGIFGGKGGGGGGAVPNAPDIQAPPPPPTLSSAGGSAAGIRAAAAAAGAAGGTIGADPQGVTTAQNTSGGKSTLGGAV